MLSPINDQENNNQQFNWCSCDPIYVAGGALISTTRKLGATVYSLGGVAVSCIGTAMSATCLAGAIIGEYAIFGGLKVAGGALAGGAGLAAGALTCVGAGIAAAGHATLKVAGGVLGLACSGVAEVTAFASEPAIKVLGAIGNVAGGIVAGAGGLISGGAGLAIGLALTVPAGIAAGAKVAGGALAGGAGLAAGALTCVGAGMGYSIDVIYCGVKNLSIAVFNNCLAEENQILNFQNFEATIGNAICEKGKNLTTICFNTSKSLITNNWEDVGAIIKSPTAPIFDCAKSLFETSGSLITQSNWSDIVSFAGSTKNEINNFANNLGQQSQSLLCENWTGEQGIYNTAKAVADNGFGCANSLFEISKSLITDNWQDVGATTSYVYNGAFKPCVASLSDYSQQALCRIGATICEATIIPQYLAYDSTKNKLGINQDKWADWEKSSSPNSLQEWFCKNAKSPTLIELLTETPNNTASNLEYQSLDMQHAIKTA